MATRVGTKWTIEEDEKVMRAAINGKSIDDIAAEHKRTATAIKYRIMSIGIARADENGISYEDLAQQLHIPLADINTHKKKLVEQKTKTKSCDVDSILPILTEIRDLLKFIAEK